MLAKAFLIGMMSWAGIVAAAVNHPSGWTTGLIALLSAALGGGLINTVYSVRRNKKLDSKDEKRLKDRLEEQVLTGAYNLLNEYKKDFEKTREELALTREELDTLRKRVKKLEDELEVANGNRNELQANLEQARKTRDSMQSKIAGLENKVQKLENVLGRDVKAAEQQKSASDKET